jgi:hypothetical protein
MGGDGVRRTRPLGGARRAAVAAVALIALLGLVPAPPAGAATGVPSPPRSVRPFPGNGKATLKWHPPDHLNGYPVTQWRIIAYNNRNTPLPVRIFTSTSTTYVFVELTNSREYTFTVAAKNKLGWSAPSARSHPVKIGTPAKPAAPKAAGGVGRATLTWKTPNGNGATVKSYVVTPYLDGTKPAKARVFNSPATKQVVTCLHRRRRYTFTVTAQNNRGASKPSNPSAAILTK